MYHVNENKIYHLIVAKWLRNVQSGVSRLKDVDCRHCVSRMDFHEILVMSRSYFLGKGAMFVRQKIGKLVETPVLSFLHSCGFLEEI